MTARFQFENTVYLDQVESTQDYAEAIVRGELSSGRTDLIYARHQIRGRGRFDRNWESTEDDSLTASLICWNQADHPAPYLLGMAVAVAAALTFDARVQWPNDVVSQNGRKLGGILSTVVADPDGKRIPIVGLGLNLNQSEFGPEIAHRATSFFLESGLISDPKSALAKVLARLNSIPVPLAWSDLAPFWRPLDSTKGKQFVKPDCVEVVAVDIGDQGELVYLNDSGQPQQVFAADAVFGPKSEHFVPKSDL